MAATRMPTSVKTSALLLPGAATAGALAMLRIVMLAAICGLDGGFAPRRGWLGGLLPSGGLLEG